MSAEKNPRVALVFGGYFSQLGGRELSTSDLLGTRRPGLPDSPWVTVTPEKPQVEVAHSFVIPGFHLPGLRGSYPRPDVLVQLRKQLHEQEVKHALLTHPFAFEQMVAVLGLPVELQREFSVLWRIQIAPKEEFYGMFEGSAVKQSYPRGLRFMQKLIARTATMNLAISPAVARSLEKEFKVNPERIQTIPNQVFSEMTARKRHELGLEHRRKFLAVDEMGVIFASRFSPEKRLDWLPEVYKNLRMKMGQVEGGRFQKIVLGYAGEASSGRKHDLEIFLNQMGDIELLTDSLYGSDRVRFNYMGRLGKEDLEDRFNAYDILGAPSEREGFSRVVVEAMKCGMPVIANAECEPTVDMFEEARTLRGLQVGIGVQTPIEMAEKILQMYQYPKALRSFQWDAYQWSDGNYTQQKAGREFWRAMGSVM
jgi:glycosyltransferase involved in cell wall biosynthesis